MVSGVSNALGSDGMGSLAHSGVARIGSVNVGEVILTAHDLSPQKAQGNYPGAKPHQQASATCARQQNESVLLPRSISDFSLPSPTINHTQKITVRKEGWGTGT